MVEGLEDAPQAAAPDLRAELVASVELGGKHSGTS
jgi:hypothetical protein